MGILGEKRQKRRERERKSAKKLTPAARDSYFALALLSSLFAENAQKFTPVLQAMFL